MGSRPMKRKDNLHRMSDRSVVRWIQLLSLLTKTFVETSLVVPSQGATCFSAFYERKFRTFDELNDFSHFCEWILFLFGKIKIKLPY